MADSHSSGGPRARSSFWHGALRSLVACCALACAGALLLGMGSVAALPDRGLITPVQTAMIATPAALPTVSAPVAVPVPAPAARPVPGGPGGPQAAPANPNRPPQELFAAWATRMSAVTGIPARALEAYAVAHALLAKIRPGCHLTWVTLAGIARVESANGTIGGRTLLPNGRPSSPIIGIPLNGAPGVRAIAATDGGILTGDPVWEHAVGPFQFIPSTWAAWRADGNGDGMTDPQNIDDAALAAAQYLCRPGVDLRTGSGWLGAILSYNNSAGYVQQVYRFAQDYARLAQAES